MSEQSLTVGGEPRPVVILAPQGRGAHPPLLIAFHGTSGLPADWLDAAGLAGSVPHFKIVANLPYVSQSEWRDLSSDIVDYEPPEALDGGPDGLDPLRRLFMQAPQRLAPGGALMLEMGSTQGPSMMALARAAFPRAAVAVVKDLASLDRMVTVTT